MTWIGFSTSLWESHPFVLSSCVPYCSINESLVTFVELPHLEFPFLFWVSSFLSELEDEKKWRTWVLCGVVKRWVLSTLLINSSLSLFPLLGLVWSGIQEKNPSVFLFCLAFKPSLFYFVYYEQLWYSMYFIYGGLKSKQKFIFLLLIIISIIKFSTFFYDSALLGWFLPVLKPFW